jgi:hypothetical protein
MYYNFKNKVNDKPKLLTQEEINKLNDGKEAYQSIFAYTEEQKKKVESTGSIAGITDVLTDTLVWDFDSKDNIEAAKKDTIELCTRLIDGYGIEPDNIICAFSGNKGFHASIKLNKKINPEQFKKATGLIAQGLNTYDPSVSDPARIVRIDNSLNPKSGLYKIPLHIAEIDEMTVDQIKALAKTKVNNNFDVTANKLPETLFTVEKKKEASSIISPALDFSKKPKGWQDYVYAILEGHYESGERHNALMVLAAKCRSMGFDKEATYYLCKKSLKAQAGRTGSSEFDKEELWKDIIHGSIYSDRWEGGSYSPKNNPWLAKFCEKHKIRWNNLTDANITSVSTAFDSFENYATNIDNLTIKTGIPELDDNLRLTVGMSSGLVASPGVGKTSLSLQILNNMSNQNNSSVFFSYDMYAPIVYQKLVQKHFNITPEVMFHKFKHEKNFRDIVKEKISQEYKNVNFCFKTGQNVPDIIDTIKEAEDTTGQKVKFMVMDYNELVITDYSDPTQSSAHVAQKMREIAQSMDICVFSLFQPNKLLGSPSDEVKSYNSAKGSGAIAQSVSAMLGMNRPGYNPRNPEMDKFATVSCLKNRMGKLFSLDFGWHGLSGTFSTLTDEDRQELQGIREERDSEQTDNQWR